MRTTGWFVRLGSRTVLLAVSLVVLASRFTFAQSELLNQPGRSGIPQQILPAAESAEPPRLSRVRPEWIPLDKIRPTEATSAVIDEIDSAVAIEIPPNPVPPVLYAPQRTASPELPPLLFRHDAPDSMPLPLTAMSDLQLRDLRAPIESFRPNVLNRPLNEFDQPRTDLDLEPADDLEDAFLVYPHEAPTGYTGPSGVLPEDTQTSSHFVPVEDRWRTGFPPWDRYNQGQPPGVDYPYERGRWYDPYNQNVLKGDYPIRGQHLFMNFTAEIESLQEFRQVPVATSPFESTVDPYSEQFFGDPNQFLSSNSLFLSWELFHGNAAFKPVDWKFKLTTAFNLNYLDTNELAIVSPDVRAGTTRIDDYFALQEYYFEWKLADLSPHYDFLSARIGSQPFVSDFRGFIFDDVNRGARLFGTRLSNRDQFNAILFSQVEKDTNSLLNTMNQRPQETLILNYYRQDFIYPGYTAQASFHYNHDRADFIYDNNGFLARPDPVGIFQPHEVHAYYLGLAGQGHIEKLNVSNALYWVFGRDSNNPIAGKPQDISAWMAAVELSYDRDWARFRTSFFYASGDSNPNDNIAGGFDTIMDAPNFAGGSFSYWQRQQLQLFGVSLVQRESLVPDLRTSKAQGQSNFVNPGLILFNVGFDCDITPKLKMITNANYLLFDDTEVLETYTFQDDISTAIGTDLSIGFEYRPQLSDNIIFEAGIATLIPGAGLKDLYGDHKPFNKSQISNAELDPLFSLFVEAIFVY